MLQYKIQVESEREERRAQMELEVRKLELEMEKYKVDHEPRRPVMSGVSSEQHRSLCCRTCRVVEMERWHETVVGLEVSTHLCCQAGDEVLELGDFVQGGDVADLGFVRDGVHELIYKLG
ncbi:hypothetical protein Pmani_013236 [Petrolisthes manimaculis]|uniref:Uncharacterized protein n=1 Tax=Petrolisthes manimaculis TaxID=1843537 RepID=A0AAE1UDU5_9EUCA|nr:hypothetical protein Pmani_013236 [Petrolisthes manimaculis]